MRIFLQSILLIVLIFGSAIAQTFQYSRGWTNGKRSYPVLQTTCQLQRLKAMLQGKPLPPSYLLCELYHGSEGNKDGTDRSTQTKIHVEDDMEK